MPGTHWAGFTLVAAVRNSHFAITQPPIRRLIRRSSFDSCSLQAAEAEAGGTRSPFKSADGMVQNDHLVRAFQRMLISILSLLNMPLSRGTNNLQGAMIVAMATMEMMQVLAYKIVHMVSVWRFLVTTVRSVSVPTIMPVTIMFWCACVWIGATH